MASDGMLQAVEGLIAETTGEHARIVRRESVGGGCINNAEAVTLNDGRRFFVKSNPQPLPRLFECEAEGLDALDRVNAIRVPRPIGTGGGNNVPKFIVMELIESGRQSSGFQMELGRQFAHLHQQSIHTRYGFHHDNYLGSTLQPNQWQDDWVEFWRVNRLGHQLTLARRNGVDDPEFHRSGEALLARLDDLIGHPEEPPCLLHGDLWGGNYLADERGQPVLIDPAVYYGRREADLAMTMLFGGFTAAFYSAYEEVWPLAENSRTRLDIYKLYHLLNHLNLFGRSYYSGCMEIMRRYGR